MPVRYILDQDMKMRNLPIMVLLYFMKLWPKKDSISVYIFKNISA